MIHPKIIHLKTLIDKYIMLVLLFASTYFFAHNGHKKTEQKDSVHGKTPVISEQHQQDAVGLDHSEVTAFPNYHPLVVHFPIVFLLTAALFQLLSFFLFKKEFGITVLILLTLGVISVLLASNVFHAHTKGLTSPVKEILETHEQMASLTWWFALVALLFKILSIIYLKRNLWIELSVIIVLIIAAVTVSIAGHHGAMLVHIKGIGPEGKHLELQHREH